MPKESGDELDGWLVWLLVVQLFNCTLAVDLSLRIQQQLSSRPCSPLHPVLHSLFIPAISLYFSARVFHVYLTHMYASCAF